MRSLDIIPVKSYHRAILDGFWHCGNTFVISNIINPDPILDHFPENGVLSHRHNPEVFNTPEDIPKFLLIREPVENCESLVSRWIGDKGYPQTMDDALSAWINYYTAAKSYPTIVIPFSWVVNDYARLKECIEWNSKIQMYDVPRQGWKNSLDGIRIKLPGSANLVEKAKAIYGDYTR